MASKLQFTTTDEAEIRVIAEMTGRSLPFRHDGGWWEATAVRHSSRGLTVWATAADPPRCSKCRTWGGDGVVTKVMTVSNGERFETYYRCDEHAAGDQRIIPRVTPSLTVTVAEVA